MTIQFPEHFNMADYFLYHNLEEGRADKVCLYFEDQTWTYGETARLSNRAGNGLREVGLDIEDRVLIVLPDCPEFVWTWFGAARIGAVITMVNPLLPVADYQYYLEYTRARVAVVRSGDSILEIHRAHGDGRRARRAVCVSGAARHGRGPNTPVPGIGCGERDPQSGPARGAGRKVFVLEHGIRRAGVYAERLRNLRHRSEFLCARWRARAKQAAAGG